MKRAEGEWPERHARFSLPEAFFEGTLQIGFPIWRAARMFEQDPARDRDKIAERVPQTPRKDALERRKEPRSGVDAIPSDPLRAPSDHFWFLRECLELSLG
jgi:hypothetical protein